MNPYENIQIGNFLISLGYYLKSMDRPLLASVNLLQQTPLDAQAGDVLGAVNERYFIIEFKRDEKSIEDEHTKEKYKNLKAVLNGYEKIQEVATKCHLLSYGYKNILEEFDYQFLSYISFSDHSVKINSLTLFIEQLFNAKIGTNFKNFKSYVEVLYKCHQPASKSGASSGGGINSSVENMCGLVVCMDENKKMRHSTFQSLDELNLLLGMEIQREISQQKTVKKEKTQNLGNDTNIEF